MRREIAEEGNVRILIGEHAIEVLIVERHASADPDRSANYAHVGPGLDGVLTAQPGDVVAELIAAPAVFRAAAKIAVREHGEPARGSEPAVVLTRKNPLTLEQRTARFRLHDGGGAVPARQEFIDESGRSQPPGTHHMIRADAGHNVAIRDRLIRRDQVAARMLPAHKEAAVGRGEVIEPEGIALLVLDRGSVPPGDFNRLGAVYACRIGACDCGNFRGGRLKGARSRAGLKAIHPGALAQRFEAAEHEHAVAAQCAARDAAELVELELGAVFIEEIARVQIWRSGSIRRAIRARTPHRSWRQAEPGLRWRRPE